MTLLEETARRASASPKDWMNYLDTAARLYRYPFRDALLIHAQRPDAFACAELDVWNRSMNRWVNRGARGIALIDERGDQPRLRYVFDIRDTHMVRGGRTPFIWNLGEEYRDRMVDHLAETYGLEDRMPMDLLETLQEIASRSAQEGIDDLWREALDQSAGSYLEGLPPETVKAELEYILYSSTLYTLATRCGLDATLILDEADFAGITDYNRLQVLNVLGEGTHQMVEPVLMDIGRTVRRFILEDRKKEVENQAVQEYTSLNTPSREAAEVETREEGGRVNGTDISQERRLPVPESGDREDGGRIERADREIREAEEGLPEGTQGRALFWPADNREAGGAPETGGPGRGSEAGRDREPAPDETSGARQSTGPDGLGAAHEQAEPDRRGDRLGGVGVQLTDSTEIEDDPMTEAEAEMASALSLPELPSVPAQIRAIEERQAALYAGEIPIEADVIDTILRTGSNQERSQLRIIYDYMADPGRSMEDHISFLKKEYREGGKGIVIGGREYSVWFDELGLQVAEGHTVKDNLMNKAFLSWEDVAGRIGELLRQGEYAPQAVLDAARDNAMLEHARVLAYMERDLADGVSEIVFEDSSIFRGGFQDVEKNVASRLADPAFLEDLCDRLDGLALAYKENRGVMRFNFYKPDLIAAQFRKLRQDAVPYVAREGFTWETDLSTFITQDEIDNFLSNHAVYEDGRLAIYSFFLIHEDRKERTDFLRERYGTGGQSHALSGADDSFADYNGKGLTLTRGDLTDPASKVTLRWNQVEQRIEHLLDRNEYLKASDYAKMPAYERRQMASEIVSFYSRLPEEIVRPWPEETDLYHIRDAVYAGMEKEGGLEEMLARMDEVLTALPATEDRYKQRSAILTTLHQYAEGLYTIFPQKVETQADVLGRAEQMSLFSLVNGWEAEPGGDGNGFVQIREEDLPEEFQADADAVDVLPATPEESAIQAETAEAAELFPSETIETVSGEVIDEIETVRGEVIDAIETASSEDINAIETANGEVIDAIETTGGEVVDDTERVIGEVIVESADTTAPQTPVAVAAPINYRITDDDLGAGSPKEKFQANLEAIRTLKRLQAENALATPADQEILAGYVGWGGLPQAFDENNAAWSAEYAELKEILTEEEYRAARASTLNAFYTPPMVIRSMYETLERMGLSGGNVLEPSCGIGNFMGMVPDSMQDIRMYGVELDGISAGIARQLYQKNPIAAQGFEETQFPDSFFDAVIGNVPFGNYKLADRRYDRQNFLIHDYFIAKSLDLVRPGGVVAVITSSGTMDKRGESVRQYIAARADLLGAVRLPNNAFRRNAGTDVVADILIFQKRDRAVLEMPEWTHLSQTQDGHEINSYFTLHPEMVLGRLEKKTNQFGQEETTVLPFGDRDLERSLREALSRIKGSITEAEITDDDLFQESAGNIPADPAVRNYSFTEVEGKIYFRENSRMDPVDLPAVTSDRVRGMIGLRDTTRSLLELQMEDADDASIHTLQEKLSADYDSFRDRFGLISSTANKRAFSQDSSYCLLCSLEILDEHGELERKADIFTKRTIRRAVPVTSVDTASEALAVSIGEKARVDLTYMEQLCGKDRDEIIQDLKGIIFENPSNGNWETSDEYLSGNVREKLRTAKAAAEADPRFSANAEALEKVQPRQLDASEIEVRLGATWIDPAYITQFMGETFHTPRYFLGSEISVKYAAITGQWQVTGKTRDLGNTIVRNAFGTSRVNGYRLLEDALNLRDTKIYDSIRDENGSERRVLNRKETMLAQQKQELIRDTFREWIFQDMERREDLVARYNEIFNSVRPREYDGSHIRFVGMTPEITLMQHQKNAVAHILYGDNTLLAHCVGAGKTYQMVAAGMESKRLGLAQKCLYVVPNHLTEQWGADFLRLYPAANILVATKKDFEPANRKKFCSRIATGDYDAIIIGHSQFERIPLSRERQAASIQGQIDDITSAINEAKYERGERYTIKQMEKTRRMLETRLAKLNDQTRKDDVVTFEQLGVDRLFVDESHFYKNLFLYTKMRNVAGISQTDAQKSSDMFMKCQYLDELTGGRGVTFATGTPVSNSMVELYTVMRYLQYGTLQRMGLGHFDSWAASFGETVTAIELSPEGTGYRAKTRFARFFNLPELISVFKEAADVQTADMLDLPTPEAEYINEVLKPSQIQKDMVASFAERAERVRSGRLDPSIDNMLRITNDGRKCALDQRLINDMLPDDPGSKVNCCVKNVFNVWEETKKDRLTQLVFCDLSTPKADGSFNVYDDIRNKLVAMGIPKEEVAFIHEANTEARKAELFTKVRSGQVRVLLGSTPKLGAGTNVQDKLIALHHLDCPWKPSDLEQQEGRILRQGNHNPKVKIFRYVTEGTFDSYLWQMLENKQKFISQIMTSKSPVRACEDVDEAVLNYAEIKALCTGNPHIREKMDLDIQVSKLKLLKANHTAQKYRLETDIARTYPQQIAAVKERIAGLTADLKTYEAFNPSIELKSESKNEDFKMKVGGTSYTDKKEAGTALLEACSALRKAGTSGKAAEYQGFSIEAGFDTFSQKFIMTVRGRCSYPIETGKDPYGIIQRLNNVLGSIDSQLEGAQRKLETLQDQLETARAQVEKPFEKEAELAEKLERLTELNALLNLDEHGSMDAVGIDEVTAENVEEERETISEKKDLRYGRENETGRREKSTTERPGLAAAPVVPYPISMAKRLAEKKEQARSALAAASPVMPQRQALAAEL